MDHAAVMNESVAEMIRKAKENADACDRVAAGSFARRLIEKIPATTIEAMNAPGIIAG